MEVKDQDRPVQPITVLPMQTSKAQISKLTTILLISKYKIFFIAYLLYLLRELFYLLSSPLIPATGGYYRL